MNAKLLFRLLMTNTGRKILLYTTIGVLSLFFFMILILCTFLSMPKEWLNNFLSQYLGDQHIEIIYQIRPDLLDPEPEEAPNNNKDYEFVLPIKRTVRHYFGEKGSFNGVNIDYIVFDCNGDNLYSIGDGVVKEVDNTTVTIEYEASDNDPNNWFIYAKYFPMSEVNVTLGEEVEKGQIIGKADIADDVSKLKIFCFGMWGDSDPEWVDPITLIGEKTFEEQYVVVVRE